MMLSLLLVLGQVQPLNLNEAPLQVRDEGTVQSPKRRAYAINCVGSGVTCSQDGGVMRLNVAGGGGAAPTGDDEVPVGNGASSDAKVLPSCSNATTSKLLYDNTTNAFSCGTDQTGGGGGGNFVEVSVALTTEGLFFSQAVTGQAWVTGTSKVVCTPFGTTADGLTPEAVIVSGVQAGVSDLVVATGFTLHVYSPHGLDGTVRFHCTGS